MQHTRFMVRTALVAALYVVFTLAFYFLSYGAIQFRVSEIMVLLAFFEPLYMPGLILGCFVANLIGPYGVVDAIFGSLASLFALTMIIVTRRVMGKSLKALIVASLWPAVSSLIIAFEITVIFGAPESFAFWVAMVAIGEFVVVSLCGVPVTAWILKNPTVEEKLKISTSAEKPME